MMRFSLRSGHFGLSWLAPLVAPLVAPLALSLLAIGCSQPLMLKETHRGVVQGREIVKGEPVYKIGKPYEIRKKTYTPRVDYNYKETGIASWYGPKFHNRRTANNEIFDETLMTAAHRTLPLPSYVFVTNLQNNRTVRLRVNDRGPFAKGRIIDLSRQAARVLGFEKQGTTLVHVQILGKDSKRLAEQMRRGGSASLYGRGSGSSRAIASNAPVLPPAPERARAPRSAGALEASIPWKVYAQIGAFREQKSIAAASARLKALRLDLPIVEKPAPDPSLTRLLLGPLPSHDDARIESLLDRLNEAGFPESQVRVLR